ncbi:M48 family metalloprotease [Aeromonas salmonicida]|uniref:M48 family metalloprotease n=1 Tax=Aeromonas salmonicida TaxID=645 RepID=UPI003F7C8669
MKSQDIYNRLVGIENSDNSISVHKARQGAIIDFGDGNQMHVFDIHDLDKLNDVKKIDEQAAFYLAYCSIDEIRRIFNPKTQNDYLLKFRADSIVDNPRLVRVFQRRKNNNEEWSLTSFYDKRNPQKNYLENISKGNQDRLSNIPYGLAYFDSVNAFCSQTDAGNIIAISEPLSYFLYFMNIYMFGESLGVGEVDRGHALTIAFRIIAGHESFDFDIDPRGNLPTEIENEINKKTALQCQFVLGHELAHHLLGHVKSKNIRTKNFNALVRNAVPNNKEISVYEYAHKEEYDADWHAIKNIKGNNKYKSDIAESAFLFFIYLHASSLLFDAINPAAGSRISSHPSPSQRIGKLRSRLNRRYGPDLVKIEEYISNIEVATKSFISDYLPYHYDVFESYGSIYLPSYKEKVLIDRVDY